jgi:hypothetical protein
VEKNWLKGRSFWQVNIPQSWSWSWKKLLKLRDLAKNFISFKVGDGSQIFLWYDSFWWSGNDSTKAKAKIAWEHVYPVYQGCAFALLIYFLTYKKKKKKAWEHVCVPKREVGLELMRMEDWTRAAMLKHV